MKNIFRILMAVAVLFTASCAKEDISTSIGSGEANVTFTVDLPELGTRAYGEGEHATTLKFFVYEYQNENVIGKYLPNVLMYNADNEGTNVIESTSKRFNFSLTLIKGMKYNIVFWADKGEFSPYAPEYVNGVPTGVIKANYSDVYANDDTLDAFFGSLKNFDPAAADAQSKAGKVELKRPFAQLNAKTTDLTEIQRSGATLTKSALSVKTYTTLDLFSGNVGGLDEDNAVVFKSNLLPDSNGHISMNYLLAPATKCTANVTLSYTFEGANVNFPAATYSYVPLQRNYKTNIIGKLLTASTDFTVEIKPGFEEPDQAPEELFLAAVNGGEVTLTEDVVLTQPLNVQSTMTLNLNGHTISTTLESPGRHYYAIYNKGNLTITGSGNIDARGIKNFGEMVIDGNLTITNIDTDGGAAIWNEGKVTINNGNFATNATAGDGSYGAALNTRSGGEAVVNGGNFYAYSQLTYAIVNEGTTTINNAVVNGKHGAVAGSQAATATIINGGSFELLENPNVSDHCAYYVSAIYGGTFSLGNNTDSGAQVFYQSNIADGYTAIENGDGTWTVHKRTIVNDATEFAAALAEGGIVELNSDITLDEELEIPAGVTLNGNGKQINGTLVARGDVTFEGHTKVTLFYAAYNNCTTTIGEGACLEMTGTDRTTLGGTVFNITGTITDAKTADKTSIQPSLIIPGGFSITGGSDAELNIKNAYVKIGSTTSKNSVANGTFTINIEDSIAEFTNQLTFAQPTNGKNPTFNINVKNSVLTTGTKLILAAPNCNMKVDNSTINIASYFRNSGKVELKNGSTLTGSTIQFGENGGHDGKTVVDNSIFTITATSTGNPYDGRGTGSITAQNGATVTVDYYKDMTITADATSTLIGTKVQ